MKNLLAKLKGTNYKQAAIDHGEKVFMGGVGLFVLVCLGGTSWSRYDKHPKEFLDKVEVGERNIQNSAFSLEEQSKYKPLNIMQQVQTLQSPLEPGRYEYSTSFFHPMYPTAVKITEPRWLAPIQPIADFGKALIVEVPQDQAAAPPVAAVTEDSEAAKKLTAANAADDDEFAAPRRPGGEATGQAATGAPGAALGNVPGMKPPTGASALRQLLGGPMGGMETAGSSRPLVNAQGSRFVSFRAIFPLGDQLDELHKAMHESRQQVAGKVNFIDFEVERQVALPGNKPWPETWEKIDLQAALDLMDRIEFDTDLVDPSYTDNVFTMPLPRRVIGKWKRWASHPLITTLTEEQAELQAQLTAKIMKDVEEKKLDDKTGKKGLSSRLHDNRGARSSMVSNGSMNNVMKDLTSQMQKGGVDMFNPQVARGDGSDMAQAMTGFSEQVSRADGKMSKYLLFRYFDFQVTPGNAYRYRVRMKLLNPNFKRPVEELVDESIAAGEIRETPWSEPTTFAFIPEEQHMFLAKAEKPKGDGLPSAQIDVYQWFSEAGTTIAAKVEKLQLGQFIGGRVPDTEVYRPAYDTLKKEEIPVFTGSLLTDVAAGSTASGFDLVEHADLKLDDKKLKQLTTSDKALVVDRYGQMAILDNKASADERSVADGVVEKERGAIRDRLKNRPDNNPAGGALGKMIPKGDGTDDPMQMQMQQMMQPGMGGGNSLKKGAKKSPAKGKPTAGK